VEKQGWIKIHRKMADNWLWDEKPFTRAQAWIDILLSCNYSESHKAFGNTVLTCKRGESLYSLNTWAYRWGWNKSKVRRFLNLLQDMKMVAIKPTQQPTQQPTHLTTHLTVCKYDTYQEDRNADETQMKRKPTPIKEVKEVKKKSNNKNNTNSTTNFVGSDSEIHKLVTDFYTYRSNKHPDLYKILFKNKDTLIKNSILEISRLIRLDGRTLDEIRGALAWAIKDPFWSDQVVSLAGLRKKSKNGLKKFDNLFIKHKKQSGDGFTDEFMEDMMGRINNKQETK